MAKTSKLSPREVVLIEEALANGLPGCKPGELEALAQKIAKAQSIKIVTKGP